MGKFLKSIHESKDLTDEEKANSLNDLLKEIVSGNLAFPYLFAIKKKGRNFDYFRRKKSGYKENLQHFKKRT
jgi:hypothetical protein